MTAATRRAEHARQIAGFVWKTMSARGIRCERVDVEAALHELDEQQLHRIEEATRNPDADGALKLLGDFGRVLRGTLRSALRSEAVVFRADVLMAVCGDPKRCDAFTTNAATLLRGASTAEHRAAAIAQLRTLCGTLDAADAGGEAAAPPDEHEPPEHEDSNTAPPEKHAARVAPRERQQAKIYGRSAALTFEIAPTRDASGFTVMIDGAHAIGEGNPRRYDWANKIIFHPSTHELVQLLGVFMGWIPQAKFGFHGRDKKQKDKFLEIGRREDGVPGLQCSMRVTGDSILVPIDDVERYSLATLCLSALVMSRPALDGITVAKIAHETLKFTAPGAKES